MKIDSEETLIGVIAEIVGRRRPGVPGLLRGIGDDCAVAAPGDGPLLLTTDIAVEGVHFDRGYCSPADIGCRSMAANLSDIAAMGGTPRHALAALALPADTPVEFVAALYEGMCDAMEGTDVSIAGGDLSRGPVLVLSISLTGLAPSSGAIGRDGARPGDAVYLTGHTGCSRAGMECLARGAAGDWPGLALRHLRPSPRVREGRILADTIKPTAMIDVSDGLLLDLRRLCGASGTGFVLDCDALPLDPELSRLCKSAGRDPLEYLLESGEEYELLFTARPDGPSPPPRIAGTPVTRIGTVTDGGYRLRENGAEKEGGPGGHDHFRE